MDYDYHLTHDIVRIKIMPTHGYNYSILDFYALNVDDELQILETETSMDAFESKWSQRSMIKHTYGFARLPKYENMVGC